MLVDDCNACIVTAALDAKHDEWIAVHCSWYCSSSSDGTVHTVHVCHNSMTQDQHGGGGGKVR